MGREYSEDVSLVERGLVMRKSIIGSVLFLTVLTGCGANHTGKLDTSKLEKVEYEHTTKEQAKGLPILYNAPSLKVGRKALPFDMKMPDNIPFKVEQYGFNIRDFKHDGTQLRATFFAKPKEQNANMQFKIDAGHPVIENTLKNVTEIKLDEGVEGEYKGNALYFQFEDVSYNIVYWNGDISKDKQQKELIKMANEMIHN
ncbi:hypothetical protein [Bacillus sp. SORGH_AS_0510]|uniref:hypothetical protein n=1 Tax=Bacillus sp. SORGH_AS_0510 TaxID=3041771 RepID=UPI0027D8B9CE|nr:hypothetical protein [Bacillus sp. SORGH_AS_0510]